MLHKTQGIIIKRNSLSDTDRLLTIYTQDFGKILVRGKAIKKGQAKLKGHLELFLHSYLMIAQGKRLDIITNAETIDSFSHLHQDISSLAAAYYLSELIDKLIIGPEKDERIWQLILNSFQGLNQLNNRTELLKNFREKLLEYLGYGQGKKDIICSLAGEIYSKHFLQKTACLIK